MKLDWRDHIGIVVGVLVGSIGANLIIPAKDNFTELWWYIMIVSMMALFVTVNHFWLARKIYRNRK